MEPKTLKKHEDALKSIVEDFRVDKENKKEEYETSLRKQRLRSKVRYCCKVLMGLIILIAIVHIIFVLTIEFHLIKNRTSYAYGIRTENDYKLNECVFRFWEFKRATQHYYMSANKFPTSIEELVAKGFLRKGIHCPATGAVYDIKKTDVRNMFVCPNPDLHGIDKLWMDVQGGPPIIERDNEVE